MTTAMPARSPAPVPAQPRRWVLIALAAIYVYAFPYFGALRHANELPRILTTEQIVERGTFDLDERMDDLGSLADISTTPDGHSYQNKAPGLSILGVPVYAALESGVPLVRPAAAADPRHLAAACTARDDAHTAASRLLRPRRSPLRGRRRGARWRARLRSRSAR